MLSFESSSSSMSGKRTPTSTGHLTPQSGGRHTPQPDRIPPYKIASDSGHRTPQSLHSGCYTPPPSGVAGKTSPPPSTQLDRKSPQMALSVEQAPPPTAPSIVKADGSALNEQDILVMFAQVHSKIASSQLSQPLSPLVSHVTRQAF